MRGKRIAAPYFLDGVTTGFAQSAVLFGWDIAENVLPQVKDRSWELVFGDFQLVPDLATFALVPWEEGVVSCICDVVSEQGNPLTIAPRYILQQLITHAHARQV